jgi:L-methionine (R)-S-oxide reductase
MQHTNGESEALLDQIELRLADEDDLIANVATCTALLFEGMEAVDWVGIYFLRDGELVLGPFQGRAARTRISLTHPIAGRCAREGRAIIIDDMTSLSRDEDEFPARSQIAVPVLLQGRCIGILQVDSPFMNRFKPDDQDVLERASELILAASDTTSILPRRTGAAARKKPASRTESRKASTEGRQATVAAQPAAPAAKSMKYEDSGLYPSRTRRRLRMTKRVMARRALSIAVAAIFLGVAMAGSMYQIAYPSAMDSHVWLQKLYSLVAYTVVAFSFAFGWRLGVRKTALSIALYSGIIEIGQAMAGSQEGLVSNIADIFCGALGGFIGAALFRALRRRNTTLYST